jgi:glycerol-3-phosphate dehydrogenase (NAD(P)+)
MMGLSGLGDLILTCGSAQSRNMSLGRALGQGKTLNEILGSRVAVTEGVYTAAAAVRLAHAKGIDMPITSAVYAIIEGRVSVDDAIAGLMQRPFKAED